jgi:hypothetical protein
MQAPSGVTDGTRNPIATANTLYGPTGLIVVPTAYTTAPDAVQLGASFGSELRGPSVNYGIIRDVEVGGAFMDREGDDNEGIASAKVTIVPSNFTWFEIGVGIIDAVDAINQTVYVVASADLVVPDLDVADRTPVGLRVHAGVGTGIFEETLIGGGELIFANGFSIIGEYDADTLNGALRYNYDEDFSAQIGFQERDLFFGMTYSMRF